jgi:death-on-curing protein
MSEPRFLRLEQVEELHRDGLVEFGGSDGVRDAAGLESAVMHPQNIFFYGSGDLFEIAAAYAYHIAEAQAFLDGNKRAAASSALAFLRINGVNVDFDSLPALHEAMIAVANREMDKAGLAALLRELAG